ncbi:MAG: hypothetical protein R6X13_07195 [bacterium]
MKRLAVLLAASCLLSAASAQWLDRTFLFSLDTFPRLDDIGLAFVNPASGRLCLAGYDLHVFDCASGTRHGFDRRAGEVGFW